MYKLFESYMYKVTADSHVYISQAFLQGLFIYKIYTNICTTFINIDGNILKSAIFSHEYDLQPHITNLSNSDQDLSGAFESATQNIKASPNSIVFINSTLHKNTPIYARFCVKEKENTSFHAFEKHCFFTFPSLQFSAIEKVFS